MTALPQLASIAPDQANALVEAGKAIFVDIREPMEHARERIAGAHPAPLSKLGGEALARACASEAYILAGELNAWKAAGLPVAVNRQAPLDLMRQVQIATGSLAVLGAALAVAVSPWFILLSAGVGAGLVFAGVTGFCGMARLLARMPWNKVAAA